MVRRRPATTRRDPGNVVFGTIGWLFADLMFALAMVFLVATTVGQPVSAVGPSESPSPTPKPTFQKGLESRPIKMVMKVDAEGLLSGERPAKTALKRKVRANKELKGRQAGLVMSFGAGQAEGTEIADKANAVLRELGDEGFVFHDTVYKPYIDFDASSNMLTLDVYLLKE